MTIASALSALSQDITNARTAITNKGGTVTSGGGSSQLATDIATIPTGGYSELPSYQVSSGVASRRTVALTGNEFNGITEIGNWAFEYCFYSSSGITGDLDFSSLTVVGYGGLYYAFNGCSGLTSVDLSSLTTVGQSGLSNTFNGCFRIAGALDLSSLTSIGTRGLEMAFLGCSALTSADLSSLMSIGNNGASYFLSGCSGITSVDLSSLTTIDSSGLKYGFTGCKALENVYFNSLTTASFGSYTDQFANMMNNTGTTKQHTLHFPSNLQTTISGLTGYPLFNGTSGYVTLAFDLPETS